MINAAEITAMTSTVAASLDQSLPYYDKTVTTDGYGHSVETYPQTPTFLLACTISKPSATVLQTYAGIIAGKRAMMLRYLPTQAVKEGARIVYQGLNWKVQPLQTADSYTFTNDVLITEVG